MDPYRGTRDAIDAVGLLGDDPQAEVFQHRQDVRQHDGCIAAVKPKTGRRLARARVERGFERRAGEHRLDRAEIGDRLRRCGLRLVGDRKLLQPAQPAARLAFAKGLGGRLLDAVGPAAAGLREPCFQRHDIDRGHLAARRRDDKLQLRQRRIVDMDVMARQRPGERLGEDRGETLAQRGVVALARDVDDARDKALERVAPDKQREALALLQIEDADRGVVKRVDPGLEQLVAREGVEDVDQRLAVMAGRRQAAPGDDLPDFLPQQRHIARIAAISRRGEEADEQRQAGNLAVAAETAHADRVHRHTAMHG